MAVEYRILAIGAKGLGPEPKPWAETRGVITPREEDSVRALQRATERPTPENPNPVNAVFRSPETHNPNPGPLKLPVTAFEPDGTVKAITTEQELANFFSEKKAQGYSMDPNPGWGWTRDANGNWTVPPR